MIEAAAFVFLLIVGLVFWRVIAVVLVAGVLVVGCIGLLATQTPKTSKVTTYHNAEGNLCSRTPSGVEICR